MTKYFARLDEFNIVIDLASLSDELAPNEDAGIDYLIDHSSESDRNKWKEYSKSGDFRKWGASHGYTYDAARDAFIAPKPYPSWVLNETTCQYDPPIPYPDPLNGCMWDEDNQQWI
jgi:hypothetical protein|tara:strand:- start:284 stop:631 length:348 start_codon:yes stop_codon:yes gene_type:complete